MTAPHTIDFAAIREANPLPEYCAAHGIELKRIGSNLQALCPLHNETTPSFTVYPGGRFNCFGCGGRGDVIDLHSALTGQCKGDAARQLSGGKAPTIANQSRSSAPARIAAKPIPYVMTEADRMRMNTASHALAFDSKLCGAIAAARGWNEATVQTLAMDGDLGIEGDWILFGYSHGLKARLWKNGAKRFRWLCGNPFGQCWRQSLLCSVHFRIVIAEGETDAISLVSAGFEDGHTLVVGTPGATSLPNPTAFYGRDILIFPDRDEPGLKAGIALATALHPIADSVRMADWPAIKSKEVA